MKFMVETDLGSYLRWLGNNKGMAIPKHFHLSLDNITKIFAIISILKRNHVVRFRFQFKVRSHLQRIQSYSLLPILNRVQLNALKNNEREDDKLSSDL